MSQNHKRNHDEMAAEDEQMRLERHRREWASCLSELYRAARVRHLQEKIARVRRALARKAREVARLKQRIAEYKRMEEAWAVEAALEQQEKEDAREDGEGESTEKEEEERDEEKTDTEE